MRTVTLEDIDFAIRRQRILKEAKKNEEWYLAELEKFTQEKESKDERN